MFIKRYRKLLLIVLLLGLTQAIRGAEPYIMDMIPGLITDLRSPKSEQRRHAVSALSFIGRAAIPPLIEAFRDNDEQPYTLEMIRLLGKLNDARFTDVLVGVLAAPGYAPIWEKMSMKDWQLQVRTEAGLALAALGDKRAIEPLSQAAYNRYRDNFRMDVLNALLNLGDEGITAVVDCLRELPPDSTERNSNRTLLHAIRSLGAKAVPHLARALKKKDVNERYWAVHLLGEPVDDKSDEPLVRAGKDPAAVKALIDRYRDSSTLVRQAAAIALASLHDARAVKPYIALINDKDPYVRHAAISHAGKLKESWTIPPLVARLADTTVLSFRTEYDRWTSTVGQCAAWQLAGMEIADETVKKYLLHPRTDIRCHLLQGLEYTAVNERRRAPWMVDAASMALQDRDADVRQAAASALGQFPDARVAKSLMNALHDPEIQVRLAIITALGNVGDASCVPQLQPLLADLSLGTATALSLARLGDPGRRSLLEASRSKLSQVRGIAAKGLLACANNQEALDRLFVMVLDTEPYREGTWETNIGEYVQNALGNSEAAYTRAVDIMKTNDRQPLLGALRFARRNRNTFAQLCIGYLRDEDPAIRTQARENLRAYAREDYGFDVDRWQAWWDGQNRPIKRWKNADKRAGITPALSKRK